MSEYIFGPSEEPLPLVEFFKDGVQPRLDGGFDRVKPTTKHDLAATKILSLELNLSDQEN